MYVGRISRIGAICAALLGACGGQGSNTDTPPGVQTSSIQASPLASTTAAAPFPGHLIVGYQGWFGCPNDFDVDAQWRHWFHGTPIAANATVDMLPDTSAYPGDALCDTGVTLPGGATLKLFSSQSARVVDHHFDLMSRYGITGVALQRFVSDLQDPALKRRADHLLQLVLGSAQRHAVPFFVSYDVTGAMPDRAIADIRRDWASLTSASNGDAYLHDHGKPVLQIWGVGFAGNPGRADEVAALLADLKAGANGLPAASTLGGVPTAWRTLDHDSQTDSAWRAVYLSFDILSPWTVGRFVDEAQARDHYATRVAADLEMLGPLGIRYLPVIFPGFSASNLSRVRAQAAPAPLNQIPRRCGRLLWTQAQLAIATPLNAVYVAMFDEFDEGTALLPALASATDVPAGLGSVTRDQDGCKLPPDWYLTLVSRVSASLQSGQPLPDMPTPP